MKSKPSQYLTAFQALLLLLGLCWSSPAVAANETATQQLISLDPLRSISAGHLLTVQDNKYNFMIQHPTRWENRSSALPLNSPYNTHLDFTNTSIDGYVSLRWTGEKDEVFASDWYYELDVKLKAWDASGNVLPATERTLRINHRLARQQEFKDWDAFHLPGAARIWVEVIEIRHSTNGATYTTVSQVSTASIELEARVVSERFYTLDVTVPPTLSAAAPNLTQRTLTHSWTLLNGAEEYDFEWLFIAGTRGINPSTGNTYTYAELLDWDNASRVSLKHTNQYMVELPYEAGRIYFRIRAVGYGNPLEAHINTTWSNTTFLELYNQPAAGQVGALEPDKNWTYSANYAEEGKRAEALTLADGTGRGRQSVTKDNSNDRAIVAETVFDHEGRQAVQLIPSVAPAVDNQLRFHELYNLNGAGTAPIHYTDFDLNAHYNNLATPVQLAQTAGASQYFSNSNPDLGTTAANFIPDAEQMPYTRTVFDNQGRVARQGGVGTTHRVGHGHDTRYHYASVSQEDLDELFGSEIGYAQHYAMQMTTDPNGQRSISYTNLSGKTVATALIGKAPKENGLTLVDELDPNGYHYSTLGRAKKHDFVPSNELVRERYSATWMVRKEFMVTAEGDYHFTYFPSIGTHPSCTNPQGDSCAFELRIGIFDAQGKNRTSELTNIQFLSTGAVPSSIEEFFTIQHGERLTFTLEAGTDDIGAYTLVKELRLKDVRPKMEAFRAYLDTYQTAYEDYLAQYYEGFQYNLLHPNTPRPLPTPPTPPSCLDFGTVVRAAGDWLLPCLIDSSGDVSDASANYCTTTERILKQDLLPGGQYFDNHPAPSQPNGWLDAHANFSAAGPITFNGVVYNDWTDVRAASYREIEDFMENNSVGNFFTVHPEWCLYANRCLDHGTWYEDLLEQNAAWMAMSATDAQAAGYLTLPSSGFCTSTSTGVPNGPANTSYAALANILNLLPAGIGSTYETTLRNLMCNYAQDQSVSPTDYLHMAELADLQGTTSLADQWTAMRGMLLDAKERALDAHSAAVACPRTNCPSCTGYLVDADSSDAQLIDDQGFLIRIASYSALKDQLTPNTGISTNINRSGSAVDTTQFYQHLNNIRQDHQLCDYYEGTALYACPSGPNVGITLSIGIDFTNNGDLVAAYGNLTTLELYRKVEHEALCTDAYVADIQQEINRTIAALAAPLNIDLKVTVKKVTVNGNDFIEVTMWLPGASTNGNLPYNDVQLSIQRLGSGDEANLTELLYTSCNQDYPLCVCEELSALETYYSGHIANGTLSMDLYDALALHYNTELALTGVDLVNADDVRYLLKGYCGATQLTGVTFSPFLVAPDTAVTTHLPITPYPTNGAAAYEEWKAIFRADPNLPTVFHDALKECLIIQDELPCADDALQLGLFQAQQRMQEAINLAVEAQRRLSLRACMVDPPETFYMEYLDYSIHHTLYYYDASGQLEKTVPPTGVHLFSTAQAFQDASEERNAPTGTPVEPPHTLTTTYAYNTLGNVVASTAPDRGTVVTHYDRLGRAILTQNAQQQLDGQASYVVYDALGRSTETGVVTQTPNYSFASYQRANAGADFQADLDQGNFPSHVVSQHGWTKTEVRTTSYNTAVFELLFERPNTLLRNRVGTQTYASDGSSVDYQVAYNYDVFGNAQEVWQYYPDLPGNAYKQLKYDYDLIAGVVHRVDYQQGKRDQLSFRYDYDANNRLIEALSSTNGFIWNSDARYDYYLHGPLRRVELGQDRVQGMDYVYTIHGWIKGVNSNQLAPNLDPGQDGHNSSATYAAPNDRVAQDVFGYAVHYYDGDYSAINSAVQNWSVHPTGTGNLYNGNISSVTQAQTRPELGATQQTALPSIWKKYRYDLLHRISQAQTEETAVGTPWSGTGWAGTTAYQTNYDYGPNGNITGLTRYGQSTASGPIDDLTYSYTGATTPTSNPTAFANNQLLGIQDAAGSSPNHNDITSQPNTGSGNQQQNYRYDLNGSLVQDLSEEIENIIWTSEKKIKALQRSRGSTRDNLRYIYDFQGNRISKISLPQNPALKQRHQVYVRDPQGNTLAIYEYQEDAATSADYPPPVFLKEQLLYGSDRIGTLKRNVQTGGLVHLRGNGQNTASPTTRHHLQGYLEFSQPYPTVSYTDYDHVRDGTVDDSKLADFAGLEQMALQQLTLAEQGAQNPSTIFNNTLVLRRLEGIRGKTLYELKNFRGDIRQVISDVKHRKLDPSGTVVYTANVLQVTDGYPFGWEIKERSFSTDAYRFGFNGKENDSEYGEQLIQDYGFRIYNPSIGKFLSVDPLAPEYPELTPYQFASNRPIDGIDLDGLEYFATTSGEIIGQYGEGTEVIVIRDDVVKEAAYVLEHQGEHALIESMFLDGPWGRRTGMSLEELNVRSAMTVLMDAETGRSNPPATYNSWNGNGGRNKFTDKTYDEAPEDYADHPGANPDNKKGTAAGAYQFLKRFYYEDDFSPASQDKAVIDKLNARKRKGAMDAAKSGNMNKFKEKLKSTWVSLEHWSVEQLTKKFNEARKNELNNNSSVGTPPGELDLNYGKE